MTIVLPVTHEKLHFTFPNTSIIAIKKAIGAQNNKAFRKVCEKIREGRGLRERIDKNWAQSYYGLPKITGYTLHCKKTKESGKS